MLSFFDKPCIIKQIVTSQKSNRIYRPRNLIHTEKPCKIFAGYTISKLQTAKSKIICRRSYYYNISIARYVPDGRYVKRDKIRIAFVNYKINAFCWQ